MCPVGHTTVGGPFASMGHRSPKQHRHAFDKSTPCRPRARSVKRCHSTRSISQPQDKKRPNPANGVFTRRRSYLELDTPHRSDFHPATRRGTDRTPAHDGGGAEQSDETISGKKNTYLCYHVYQSYHGVYLKREGGITWSPRICASVLRTLYEVITTFARSGCSPSPSSTAAATVVGGGMLCPLDPQRTAPLVLLLLLQLLQLP